MALLKGLASINKHIEAEDAKFSGSSEDRVQTKWFKIDDKQSVKVVFLQEFDEDSENYSAKNGVGFVAVEHSNPKNFKRKAVCTFDDEGQCWACEQHQKDWKAGWRGRSRMYINVLVDDNKGDPYVAVLSQGLSGKMITPTLFEYAGEDGKISHAWFTIKRNGSGLSDTSYSIRQGKEHGLDVESYELFDLEKVVRQVPYAEQEAHYRSGEEETPADEAPSAPAVSAGSTSVDSEW